MAAEDNLTTKCQQAQQLAESVAAAEMDAARLMQLNQRVRELERETDVGKATIVQQVRQIVELESKAKRMTSAVFSCDMELNEDQNF
jgi:hypothetical protein